MTSSRESTPSASPIWMLGDVHGDYSHALRELAEAHKRGVAPSAVIFLGDIEADRPFAAIAHEVAKAGGGVEAWFIHGNHDVDQETFAKNLFDAEGADRNLHARVVEIAGVRIAGLGGVFEKEIWHPDVRGGDHAWHSYAEYAAGLTRELEWGDAQAARGRLLKHRASIFMDAYETLFDDSADVLVLHEAPACHPRGFSVLDDLAQALGVSRVFHGHHHDNLDYSQFSATAGYTVRGVGYRGIADLQGDGVRKGAYDDDRDNLPGP